MSTAGQSPPMPGTPARAHGTSMVEVLVAVFVLSIGLLGAAGLQITSKRSNFEATQRSFATMLAQDIVERMRVNGGQLAVYTNGGLGRLMSGASIAAIDCTAGCTPQQIAQFDLHEWEQGLSGVAEQQGASSTGGLTLPTACIEGPNGGAGTYTVVLAWRGLTRLSNPGVHACGQGSGLYDATGGAVEPDVYRRVLVVETFIANPV